MNKIYNNLNIDKLIKTEWFNQFNLYQQEEILEGLEKNLDVSFYAKKEFTCYKMEQIRLGLEEGFDVSIYANPKYTWKQMEEIRLGLRET